MSKVLRRPLFRGGPVDPRGTGITSGLDTPKRGLVDGPGGYAGYQFSETPFAKTLGTLGQESRKIGAGIYDLMGVPLNTLSRYFTGYNPGFSGAKFFGLEEDQPDTSSFLGIPTSTKQGFEIASMQPKQSESPRAAGAEEKFDNINNLYASLNNTATDARYVDDIEGVAGEGEIAGLSNELISNKTLDGLKTYKDIAMLNAKLRSFNEAEDREMGDREKSNTIMPDETEISQEDIIDSIFKERVAKAKRGDIADVLGGAAEGFLTGGLREGLVGATRASRAPGRAEQLENALASLKVQDKLGQAKEARTQKFELEKLEKALKGQEKIAALKGPALSDYGKKRTELIAQGFDSNTADRIARGGYANLDELMIAKPDLPLRQFETAVRYIYGENSIKGKLTEEELKDQTLLNNLDPGIYIVDKERTIVDTRSGKPNTIRY